MSIKSIGLIAQKCGMTRIFTEDGVSIPVTVFEVKRNQVVQIKTAEKEGYCALQVTSGEKKVSRVTKPVAKHFAKAGVIPGNVLCEFRINESDLSGISLGHEFTVAFFKEGQKVDVSGVTRGKGFSGVIKRHNFSSQRASHGNSLSHNAPGSIGQNQSPGRVFKGKKMAGQLGNRRRTIQNLEVVRVDAERNLLLIKGAVPGAPGKNLIIKPAVKQRSKSQEAA